MRSGSLPCLGALHDASGLGGQPLCVQVSPRSQSFSSGCAGDAGEQAVAIVRAPPPIGPASLAGFRVTLSKWTGLRSYLAEESSAAGRSFRPRVTSGGAGGESVPRVVRACFLLHGVGCASSQLGLSLHSGFCFLCLGCGAALSPPPPPGAPEASSQLVLLPPLPCPQLKFSRESSVGPAHPCTLGPTS